MFNVINKEIEKITKEDIINAKNNVDLLYIPNALASTTKWDEFISHCDYLFKNQNLTLPSPVKTIGALQFWDELFIAGYYLENGQCFSQISNLLKITEFLYGRKNDRGCTLINFTGEQKTIPVHKDIRDSFLWQAIGTVEWRIHETESKESNYQTLLVKPGDMLFIPSGIFHTVYCANPRAGISIFYDPIKII